MSQRILIVDDHFFVRQGIKWVLQEHFPECETSEAENGRVALQSILASRWDAVLLDLSMPDVGGLEALRAIKEAKPELPVVILTMSAEDQFAIRVLKAGAAAYICKESAGTELVKAMKMVLRGERYITARLAEKIALHVHQNPADVPHEQLSNREDQVMRLLAAGKTVKEIAVLLSLSVKTVSTYRTRILEKLHLRNNADIMRYALKHGLIDAESAAL